MGGEVEGDDEPGERDPERREADIRHLPRVSLILLRGTAVR